MSHHKPLPIDLKLNQTWNIGMHSLSCNSDAGHGLDDCHIVSAMDKDQIAFNIEQEEPLYDTFMRAYAEMLYRWQLLVARSQILKQVKQNFDQHRDVETYTECQHCEKLKLKSSCKHCRRASLSCSLCRLPVRGLANVCLSCGHGGHSNHMKRWFEVNCSQSKLNIISYSIIHFIFRAMNDVRSDVVVNV